MKKETNKFEIINEQLLNINEKIEQKVNELIHKVITDRAEFWIDEVNLSFIEEVCFDFKGKILVRANSNFEESKDRTLEIEFKYLPVYECTTEEIAVMMFADIHKLDI